MKGLTARQNEIWDLKMHGRTTKQIASELGVFPQAISNTFTVIRKKMRIPAKTPEQQNSENVTPELAAAAIDAASLPMVQQKAIELVNRELQAAGIPAKVNMALVKRMRVKYGNAISIKKAHNTNEIIESIEQNLYLIDSYIDDKVCAEASLRDLGLVKAALIEKRNLLKGEPTQIISSVERAKMNELLPILIEEGRRRGITIEGEKVVEDV